MGVVSETAIMNSALRKLGAERINAPTDANNRARIVSEAYPMVRNRVLRMHPWNFATSYAALAVITPKPAEIFDYGAVFALPANCSRVFSVNLSPNASWEELEGGRLGCNADAVSVKYGKLVTDTTKFDDEFAEVLAWFLAADIAYALTQSNERAESAKDNAEKALRSARGSDAQVGKIRPIVSGDSWLGSRY